MDTPLHVSLFHHYVARFTGTYAFHHAGANKYITRRLPLQRYFPLGIVSYEFHIDHPISSARSADRLHFGEHLFIHHRTEKAEIGIPQLPRDTAQVGTASLQLYEET
jgi:hypothetical protein